MKVKSKGTVKELRERQKKFVIGNNGCAVYVWRFDDNTLRLFLPLVLDGPIKSWQTNEATNHNLLHGFFSFLSVSEDDHVQRPQYADTPLGIAEIYRVENGIAIDCLAPGAVQGGMYVIQNLLTIEIE